MGLRFRKSVNIGPVRMTASKSGLSTSVGVKGARITKTSKGKTRVTASMPGTGLSYVTESGKKNTAAPAAGGGKPVKKWKIALIVVAALLVLGAIQDVGKGSSAAKPAASEAPARTVVVVTEAPKATVKPSPKPQTERTYVLNKSTGVVHVPGCRWEKQMKDENREEITCTHDELVEAGYNLCDTCKP